jgi:uncharacterized membrane protein
MQSNAVKWGQVQNTFADGFGSFQKAGIIFECWFWLMIFIVFLLQVQDHKRKAKEDERKAKEDERKAKEDKLEEVEACLGEAEAEIVVVKR